MRSSTHDHWRAQERKGPNLDPKLALQSHVRANHCLNTKLLTSPSNILHTSLPPTMPPKKRARVSQATSPAATDQHKTPTPAAQGSSPSKNLDEDLLLNDPWTDEEAIGLFKAVIKWKPTGIHKHFRMLQIRQYLLSNHYIHPKSAHTTIPGLWHKLHTLYDLDSLDEREDARQLSDLSDSASNSDDSDDSSAEDDLYSLADNKIHTQPFSLPEDDAEIADMAWNRRFPSEKEMRDGSESPAVLPEVNMDREAPVGFVKALRADVPGEDEPLETPEVEEATASTVAKRGEGRRSTRQAAEPEDEDEDDDEEEGSGEESGEDEEGDEDDDDNENEDEDDDDDEEQSSEEEQDGSEDHTPAPRSGRSGRTRGRPARASGNVRGRGRKK
ncbi:hypothetical protein Q7P37_000059 [Cladosporium fusiforme]